MMGPIPGIASAPTPAEKADHSAQHSPTHGTCRCTLGGLGASTFDQLILAITVAQCHTDLLFGEPRLLQTLDRALGVWLVVE